MELFCKTHKSNYICKNSSIYGVNSKSSLAYPTLILFIGLLTSYGFLYYLFEARQLSELITIAIGAFLAYSMFTVVHESSHGNISRGIVKYYNLEHAIGWISGCFLFFPFSAFKVIHLKHHAHTNDSEEDPDGYVRGNNLLSVFLRCFTLIGHYYVTSLGSRSKENEAIRKTRAQTFFFLGFIFVILALVIKFNLWYNFLVVFCFLLW